MSQHGVLYGVLAAVLLVGVAITAIVFMGARTTQDAVFESIEDTQLYDESITHALFQMQVPNYGNESRTCTQPWGEQAYLNVDFQYQLVPQSCSIIVDQKLHASHGRLDPSCVGECPVGTFTRTFPLGPRDIRDGHVVRLCCDDICVEKRLSSLCPQAS